MLTRENGKYFSAGLDALLAVVNPFPLMVKVTSISNIIHHIIVQSLWFIIKPTILMKFLFASISTAVTHFIKGRLLSNI